MLETKRLLIRRFLPADWQDLHAYLSDPAVVEFEPYGVFLPEESKSEALRRAGDDIFWAVVFKENGKVIGNLTLSKQDFNTFELGYVFNQSYQGHGYATESAQALIGEAFQERGARRITAMCNPRNARSWRLLERLRFRREGHLIQNVWFKKDANGQPVWFDTFLYGLLYEEWAAAGRRDQIL